MKPREPTDRERRRPASRDGVTATAERCARRAADYVADMTGREPEAIVSLEHTDDGGWLVDVEVVETRRVPDSTDILAVYEAELDAEGELVGYRRVKRYSRCQMGER
jgi:Gas vesicle synthesis protein GvpO